MPLHAVSDHLHVAKFGQFAENPDEFLLPQIVQDPAAAAALVGNMEPSPARAAAAVAVAGKWFPELSSDTRVSPEKAAWLTSLDPDSIWRVMDQVQWGWATSDPKSMATFLATSSSEQILASAYSILARQMARQNPAETLEWASHLPETQGLAAGSAGFAEWHMSQPEAAMKWLNELPPTDARRQPFFQSAIQTLACDPQSTEKLAALTGTERALARTVIQTMFLPEDRRTRLLDLLAPH